MYRHLKNGDDCARLAASGGLMYQMNKNLLARAKMSKHLSTPLLGTSDSSGSALHIWYMYVCMYTCIYEALYVCIHVELSRSTNSSAAIK